MTKVAFLGLGAMGRRMAARLVAAGHDVTVWNRSHAADAVPGAVWADTPIAAAQRAEVVISMVTDDAASRAVWTGPDGAIAGLGADALAVECSTVSPRWVAALCEEVTATGAAFVDAPVAGSRPQAEAGALLFLAGGPDEALARLSPVATAMGQSVLHAGPVGQGMVLKMMVNAMLAIQTAAMTDMLGYATAQGMPAATALDLLGQTPVLSGTAKAVGAQILEGGHTPMFTVDLMAKDLGYVLNGSAAPMVVAAKAEFDRASAAGLGPRHITAIAA